MKKINKNNSRILIFIAAFITIVTNPVSAKVTIQPRVATGLMDYGLTITDLLPAGKSGVSIKALDTSKTEEASDTLAFIGLGGTLIFEKNFVDVYFQTSADGSYDDIGTSGVSGDGTDPLSSVSSGDFDRTDYAIAFGRAVTDSISLSIGFKSGETNLGQSLTLTNTNPGNMTAPVTTLPETNPHITEHSFKLDGPFIAGTYGKQVGKGVVGFNLAVADLEGQFKSVLTNVGTNSSGTFTSNPSGDATGVTLGVSWKAPINNNWSYALSADYYNYDFDIDGYGQIETTGGGGIEGGNPTVGGIVVANVEEQVTTFRLSFLYRFNMSVSFER